MRPVRTSVRSHRTGQSLVAPARPHAANVSWPVIAGTAGLSSSPTPCVFGQTPTENSPGLRVAWTRQHEKASAPLASKTSGYWRGGLDAHDLETVRRDTINSHTKQFSQKAFAPDVGPV